MADFGEWRAGLVHVAEEMDGTGSARTCWGSSEEMVGLLRTETGPLYRENGEKDELKHASWWPQSCQGSLQ